MTRRTKAIMLATLAMSITIGAGSVRASDPIGVYGLIDKVSVTPSAGGPAIAQIWGAFSIAVVPPSGNYKPEEAYGKAIKGYLLFTCPSGQQAACEAEWNDLKSLAGTGEVAGFGTRWGTAPRVRSASDTAGAPDSYKTNVGVIRMGRNGDYPTLVSALKAASEK